MLVTVNTKPLDSRGLVSIVTALCLTAYLYCMTPSKAHFILPPSTQALFAHLKRTKPVQHALHPSYARKRPFHIWSSMSISLTAHLNYVKSR